MSSLQRKTNLSDFDDHDLRYRMKYEILNFFSFELIIQLYFSNVKF
jgi:hypothetical protein